MRAMELNVWTSTNIQGKPTFDSSSRTWTVHLQRSGQSDRILHPRHIVLASGQAGEARIPHLPGSEEFNGDIYHSSVFPGASKYRGKRAVVVGCGNSGHDIAMEFFEQGAKTVTMVQRSSTYVMSQAFGVNNSLGSLYYEGGPPTEDADLLVTSMPFLALKTVRQHITQKTAHDDREILTKLEAVGFKLDYGYEGCGLLLKYLILGGGFYIDVGCSKLIGDGKIQIKQGKKIIQFVENGLVFEDETKLEADVVVLATGFKNMRETARKIFGDEFANQVKDVWGLTDEGEVATMWQSTDT